jgi:hypothetical protein
MLEQIFFAVATDGIAAYFAPRAQARGSGKRAA